MRFSSTALARMQKPSMLCDAQHAHNRAWQWKIFCQQPCHKPEIACNVIGLHLVWRTRFTIATWNNSSPPIWYWLQYKAKKNKFCLKAATCICFSVHVWFSKIQAFWFFFCLLIFFFQFFMFMNFLVKIYMKIYDRHRKTLWTTDFFNSVFCLSFSSKNQVPYFILNQAVTDANLTRLLLKKKKTLKKRI